MNKSDTIAVIRSLLSSTSSSYSISNLNKEFKNETGMDIPLFGYNNIGDFLLSIPQTVKLSGIYPVQQVSLVANEKSAHIVSLVKHQKCKKQKRKICSAKNPSRKTRVITRCTEVEEPQKVVVKENLNCVKEQDEDRPLMSFGVACLKNGLCTHEKVPLIDLKLHAPVGEYIEVYPCEILSPNKFFFHLRKFKKKFRCLMNKLQTFYETQEQVPTISASLIRPKQICAVFHKIHSEAKWYRAEIEEIVGEFHVIVNFIDFGSRAEILKDNLKFLHQDFISLPRQGCLGFLANIKPKKLREWSSRAVKRFIQLAFEKDLVAGVVHIDTKANCAGMALSLTKGKEIHINDALVKEGYAEFEMEASDNQLVVGVKTDSPLNSSRKHVGKRQLFTEKTRHKEDANESSTSEHPESNILPKVQISFFYAPNVYSSNFRLKKMFSLADKM